MVSIDQNEEENAKAAVDFWTTRKEPWASFHATREQLENFPAHGLPYMVVIDASGRVVFSESGFDEAKLRAALMSVGVLQGAAVN